MSGKCWWAGGVNTCVQKHWWASQGDGSARESVCHAILAASLQRSPKPKCCICGLHLILALALPRGQGNWRQENEQEVWVDSTVQKKKKIPYPENKVAGENRLLSNCPLPWTERSSKPSGVYH